MFSLFLFLFGVKLAMAAPDTQSIHDDEDGCRAHYLA